MKKNGNGSLDRRVTLLENAYLEDRRRWKQNDKRLEAILRVIQREMSKNDAREKKNDERWKRNEERIEPLFRWLYRKMEG